MCSFIDNYPFLRKLLPSNYRVEGVEDGDCRFLKSLWNYMMSTQKTTYHAMKTSNLSCNWTNYDAA
jgi:hypothetical protein